MGERVFVGVAWPYANGPLHAGHIAGAYLPADIFARYHRLKGSDVLMVSGSDCHGTPITLRAEAEGITHDALVRRYHESFLRTFSQLGIAFDLFTQTHSANHHAVVSDFFRRLAKGGYFRSETLRAPYSATAGRFLPDRYVEGRCPACGFDAARGDQCERCGRLLDPEDLVEARSILDGSRITFRSTEHLVLELSKLEPRIRDWFNHVDSDRWRPNTLGLTRDWLERGLEDRAITRDIEWGVAVPVSGDAFAHKRLYVWFEAVIGYLSASIEWAFETGEPDAWKNWWLAEGSGLRSVYFIGKDNIPFHTIIWPGLLIAHDGLQLPSDVPANEFLNLEGQKMSTSRGWALTLPEVEGRFQADALRYYLAANAPESRDANWSWQDFVRRNNGELVGVWGNLVNRTLGLGFRQWGRVPKPGPLQPEDQRLLQAGRSAFGTVATAIEAVQLRSALEATMKLAHAANLYLAAEEPWKRIRNRPERAATVIYTALQTVSDLATLFSPFLPQSSAQLRTMLGYPPTGDKSFVKPVVDAFGERSVLRGIYTQTPGWWPAELPVGQVLGEPTPLFEKLDTAVAERELDRLHRKS